MNIFKRVTSSILIVAVLLVSVCQFEPEPVFAADAIVPVDVTLSPVTDSLTAANVSSYVSSYVAAAGIGVVASAALYTALGCFYYMYCVSRGIIPDNTVIVDVDSARGVSSLAIKDKMFYVGQYVVDNLNSETPVPVLQFIKGYIDVVSDQGWVDPQSSNYVLVPVGNGTLQGYVQRGQSVGSIGDVINRRVTLPWSLPMFQAQDRVALDLVDQMLDYDGVIPLPTELTPDLYDKLCNRQNFNYLANRYFIDYPFFITSYAPFDYNSSVLAGDLLALYLSKYSIDFYYQPSTHYLYFIYNNSYYHAPNTFSYFSGSSFVNSSNYSNFRILAYQPNFSNLLLSDYVLCFWGDFNSHLHSLDGNVLYPYGLQASCAGGFNDELEIVTILQRYFYNAHLYVGESYLDSELYWSSTDGFFEINYEYERDIVYVPTEYGSDPRFQVDDVAQELSDFDVDLSPAVEGDPDPDPVPLIQEKMLDILEEILSKLNENPELVPLPGGDVEPDPVPVPTPIPADPEAEPFTGVIPFDNFHGVWDYVTHLFETGLPFVSAIGSFFNALPDCVTYCFLGAFVVVLFVSVASKILR